MALCCCALSTYAQVKSQKQALRLQWQVGHMEKVTARPSTYYPATVPGAVQHDYQKGKKLPHFSIGTNVDAYKELEDLFWCYQTSFSQPQVEADEELVFFSKGIDYEFDILLNGQLLLHQAGMFTPVRLVLDEANQGQNTLEVIIYPIPKAEGQSEGRLQAIMAVKPPVTYSWDWHPRLVTVGIWDETGISIEAKAGILSTDFTYQLNEELSRADISYSFKTTAGAAGHTFEWTLKDVNGAVKLRETGKIDIPKQQLNLSLDKPELWWTYDHGSPYLYTAQLQIRDEAGRPLSQETVRVGFRNVELVMNEGAWSEPMDFPKSRSVPPFTMRLNNQIIFAKGSNWVHPEVFYGLITPERYREQLELVQELNMNMLRVWGGGITNKAAFFEQCDEMGILVWQEFPLACNPYPDDPHYLEILEQEAASIIKTVRQHPCLSMWSGGNELFNNWSGMTEQSHALRLLNSLCYRLDPHTPYINTSPVFGVGHGHYLFYDEDDDLDVFQRMSQARNTAYTEFGMPSLAPLNTLKSIIPPEEQFPVSPTPSWVVHGGFKAWKASSWAELKTLERYFGPAEDLEELVWQSQTLQAIGYKAIFEEGRRQKPYCSMVLNWCLNEPWPTAANNSIIAYPNLKKPSFEAVKAALRPIMASAKFERFDFLAGSQLEFDLWMLNDRYKKLDGGLVKVFLTTNGQRKQIATWHFDPVQPNQNLEGPRIRYQLPAGLTPQLAKISVEVEGKEAYHSDYFILIKTRSQSTADANRLNY